MSGELDCTRCGAPNPVWYAPDDVWNRAMRRHGVEESIVCPSCFALLAESAEPGIVRWAFIPETAEVIQ